MVIAKRLHPGKHRVKLCLGSNEAVKRNRIVCLPLVNVFPHRVFPLSWSMDTMYTPKITMQHKKSIARIFFARMI